jgi:hypothetical protein
MVYITGFEKLPEILRLELLKYKLLDLKLITIES